MQHLSDGTTNSPQRVARLVRCSSQGLAPFSFPYTSPPRTSTSYNGPSNIARTAITIGHQLREPPPRRSPSDSLCFANRDGDRHSRSPQGAVVAPACVAHHWSSIVHRSAPFLGLGDASDAEPGPQTCDELPNTDTDDAGTERSPRGERRAARRRQRDA